MTLLNHLFKFFLRFCTWNRRIRYSITHFSFVWLLIFFTNVVHADGFNIFPVNCFLPAYNFILWTVQMITSIGEISTWCLNTWTTIWRKYCTIVPHPKSRYSSVLLPSINLAHISLHIFSSNLRHGLLPYACFLLIFVSSASVNSKFAACH